MKKGAAGLILMLLVGACALVMACLGTAWWAAPRVLGAGPDGIDLRLAPGAIEPEAALPPEVGRYTRAGCQPVTIFRGLQLGPNAVEAVYTGPDGRVRVVAARMASSHEAASAVAKLAAHLEEAGVLGSRRLLAEEPYQGWWSASGKRNFAFWYAPDWGRDRHGFVWQNGRWCFIVSSDHPVARRDVTLAFPY